MELHGSEFEHEACTNLGMRCLDSFSKLNLELTQPQFASICLKNCNDSFLVRKFSEILENVSIKHLGVSDTPYFYLLNIQQQVFSALWEVV